MLDEDVVPMCYGSRNLAGVPRCWVERIKPPIRPLAWRFNAERMVQDYVQHLYLPASIGSSCQMPPP